MVVCRGPLRCCSIIRNTIRVIMTTLIIIPIFPLASSFRSFFCFFLCIKSIPSADWMLTSLLFLFLGFHALCGLLRCVAIRSKNRFAIILTIFFFRDYHQDFEFCCLSNTERSAVGYLKKRMEGPIWRRPICGSSKPSGRLTIRFWNVSPTPRLRRSRWNSSAAAH